MFSVSICGKFLIMSIVLAPDSLTQYNLIRFSCAGETVYGQWSDAKNAYQLSDFGASGTDIPSATTYATLLLLFAAAAALISPFATNSAEPGGPIIIDCNPEHVYIQQGQPQGAATWAIADFGPGGAGTYSGTYSTVALAFAAAAALF